MTDKPDGKPKDARSERRLAVEVSATVTVDGKVIAARTRDISRSGLCLVSDTQIARDADVKIQLVLSLGSKTMSEPLGLSGRGAWCTAMFGKYQVGVKFVDVDAERRRFLDLFMRFLNGEIKPAGMAEIEPEPSEPIVDKDDPFRP